MIRRRLHRPATGGIYFERHQSDILGLTASTSRRSGSRLVIAYGSPPRSTTNRQVAGGDKAHAWLLTPLGVMIIPGDVNGDVSRGSATTTARGSRDPIDLERRRRRRCRAGRAVARRTPPRSSVSSVEDCNGNGAGDHCDIAAGTSLDCDLQRRPRRMPARLQRRRRARRLRGRTATATAWPIPATSSLGHERRLQRQRHSRRVRPGWRDERGRHGLRSADLQMLPERRRSFEEMLVTDAGIIEDVNLTLNVHLSTSASRRWSSEPRHGTTVTILDRPGISASTPTAASSTSATTPSSMTRATGPFLENFRRPRAARFEHARFRRRATGPNDPAQCVRRDAESRASGRLTMIDGRPNFSNGRRSPRLGPRDHPRSSRGRAMLRRRRDRRRHRRH